MRPTPPEDRCRETRRGRARRRAGAAAALLLVTAGSASAYEKTFNAGSLIIPAQQEYQTDSGMLSAYGLVYTILHKNAARIAANKKPITIYWTLEPRKQSHHRCWTGNDTLPDYGSFNDNDGCDFAVQSSAGRPVALVAVDGTEVSPFWACGLDATNSANITRNASNCDPQTVSSASGTSGTKKFPAFQVGDAKKVMKYAGAQWVIEATDRNDILQMLATDPDLAQYHKNGTCGNTQLGAGCHYVNIHSAKVTFTAPVARIINVKPPLIALLGAGAVNILEQYLSNAGLTNIADYAGPLARDATTGVITAHGVIYDVLEPVTDFVSKASSGALAYGILNYPLDPNDATSGPFYQVLWAPHWVASSESTVPRDGDAGDDQTGDGQWTHGGDDAITNALENIAWFADQGAGIFAECASIESFEGSYKENNAACSTTYACELTTDPTTTVPYQCAAGYTPACNGCYSCPADTSLAAASCQELSCVGTCAAGTTAACNSCYSCPAGYTVNADNCNNVVCVPTSGCPAGYTTACSGCYSCNTGNGWVLVPGSCTSAPTCHKCSNSGFTYSPGLGQCVKCNAGGLWNETQLRCYDGVGNVVPHQTGSERTPQPAGTPSYSGATAIRASNSTPTSQDPTCPTGYSLFCPGATLPIDVPGNEATHFQVSNRLLKNGLGNSFSGPDCTDRETSVVGFHDSGTGDCLDFHPDAGGPGNIFSQKGNYTYSGTSGHIHQYMPPDVVGSVYLPNVFRMATSRNPLDASRDDWDFASTRHKDGDPAKGMVVYLAGHTYNNNAAGTRWVLNTLLNLSFSSAGVELARSEPVGYRDETQKKDLVYQGTYVQLPPPAPFQDWAEYTVDSTKSWRFPYIAGHLYQYALGSITGSQDFKEHIDWDAAARMPLPGARTLFTALNGSGNLGWKKVNFNYLETAAGCVDTDTDKKCDLSEMLAACATAGVTTATLEDYDAASAAQRNRLGMFVQQVRGFCSSNGAGTPNFTPADSQCDDLKQQKNRAKLGGVDHGSPAIVGPSRYVTKTPWDTRPVVAYVGARDGMLHAIYVSGGSGWADPSGAGLPAGIQAGQELWAFIPPGQICGLATNNAMVDASVNVIDVFGDFPTDANGDGVIDLTSDSEKPTGRREWRTVLLAAAGQGGSELFAMDVTNPIHPVLLWHMGGASEKDGRWDGNGNGVFGTGEVFDTNDPRTFSYKWVDTPAANGVTKLKSGRYDYANLGLTYGTAIGKVWEGNAFRYVGYVATSSADFTDVSAPLGYRGVEVFAFDLVTGQKLWQWQRRYTRTNGTSVIADNSIPGRLALADVDLDGSVDRIYVGDMEGHFWELDARRGGNLNYLPSRSAPATRYSFPLYGTPAMVGTGASDATLALFTVPETTTLAQQPLTSPIGQGRFSKVPTNPKDLTRYLLGRLAMIQGTMGVDWAIAPFEKGHVYVLPVYWEQYTRIAYFSTGQSVDLGATPDPRLYGLLKPEALWDIELLTGERVYGMPRVCNNNVVFNTAFGSFTGDITDSLMDAGNLYIVKSTGATVTPNDSKSFGGVLVFQDKLIVTTASKITSIAAPTDLKGGTQAERPFNRSTPATFKTWEPQAPVEVNR